MEHKPKNQQQTKHEQTEQSIMQTKSAQNQQKIHAALEHINEELKRQLAESQEHTQLLQGYLRNSRTELSDLKEKNRRFKKLLIVKLLKPLIQIEQGIRSANRYRRDFHKLAHKKGGFAPAWAEVKQVYQESGLRAAKQFLREHTSLLHSNSGYALNIDKGVVILTVPHTYYVAELIRKSLEKINIQAEIVLDTEMKHYSDKCHIVICPQIFKSLPQNYIAFQMEQTVSSRWFTDEYLQRLEQAQFIFDYSLANIEFLHNKNIPFSKLYYLPIGLLQETGDEATQNESFAHDVIFYGDANNERRQHFLNKLREKFSVKVISNTFGKDLYQELKAAKVVVNIHYYENALLETTRIYECLSLDKVIVSETSSDQAEHAALNGIVDFVEMGDVDAMIERIGFWLKQPNQFNERVQTIRKQRGHAGQFQFYFYRFLLAQDILDFEQFYELCAEYVQPKGGFWCLSLPESVLRRKDFQRDNHYGIEIVAGLRHKIGWIGCGLSYKFMMRRAEDLQLPQVSICEDDVLFHDDFAERYKNIQAALSDTTEKWHVFSGLIADLSADTQISFSDVKIKGENVYAVSRLVSMVFNIYHQSAYSRIYAWDSNDRDMDNTIDRYIESHGGIRGLVVSPFLVGHKEDLSSTLWGKSNTHYLPMIAKSQQLLDEKIAELNQ